MASQYQELHPDGYYKVRVIGNMISVSKNTGMPYIVLKVEVVEKSGKNTKNDFIPGAHRYVNLFLTEKGLPLTEAVLQAAGVDTTDEDELNSLSADAPTHRDLSGFEFFARNQQNEWNGKVRDNFSPSKNWEVRSADSWMRNMAKPGKAEKAQLAAIFGASKKLPSRGPAHRPAPAPRTFDEEVPF